MNQRTIHRLYSRSKNLFSSYLSVAITLSLLAVAVYLALPVRKTEAQRAEPTEKFRRMKNPIPGQYIVVLKDDQVPTERVDDTAAELSRRFGGKLKNTWQSAIRGFVIQQATESAAINISNDPQVDYVMEDAKGQIASAVQATPTPTPITQTNPPGWGLDRIDQRDIHNPNDKAYNYTKTGAGVRVYVIDSGINLTHQDFGGRAFLGADFVGDGLNGFDCMGQTGHGTCAAGIIGGATFGVAKSVNLYSVRIMDCLGGSTISTVVDGLNWVSANHVKPAVANMSFNWTTPGVIQPINDAVKALIRNGVTCVVTAGNVPNESAATTSPGGQVEEALTIGSSTMSDTMALSSSNGPTVDLLAPGHDVITTTRG
jgi:subtilisin family serine protease